MIEKLGRLVNKQEQSLLFIDHITQHLESISSKASLTRIQPLVYFEEWFDPLISGISWVSEIIELCGGIDVFREHRDYPDAKRRIIDSTDTVVEKMPDIMIASWCGKGFKKEKVLARPGWNTIPAIHHNEIYEIKSSIILQPGPAALIDGATMIHGIINSWQKKHQMGIK
jgi:iron complex transport system substrate-binding protein